jgi:hypothetical protein
MKGKRGPVWPDSGPWAPAIWTRALRWKQKGSFSYSTVYTRIQCGCMYIITRAARSAPSIVHSLRPWMGTTLLSFSIPPHSDTIPLSPSVPIARAFVFLSFLIFIRTLFIFNGMHLLADRELVCSEQQELDTKKILRNIYVDLWFLILNDRGGRTNISPLSL